MLGTLSPWPPTVRYPLMQHEEYTTCVCGEEVGVQVEFRNPLAVKLKVGRESGGEPQPDCVAAILRRQSSSLPVPLSVVLRAYDWTLSLSSITGVQLPSPTQLPLDFVT